MSRKQPAVRRITEKQFMAQVVELARLYSWLVYHTNNSRHSESGFPDLVLLKGPRIIVAELKIGKRWPTAEQDKWLLAFQYAGVPAFVWTPAGWAEIERTLGEERQR